MHENFPRSSAVNPVPQGRATPVEYLPVGGPRYANNDGSAKPPPLPYAHMQSTAGDPVSGVPGGPQPRYNPFTDGPPPVAPVWYPDPDETFWLFVAGVIGGIGLVCLAVYFLGTL